MNFFIDRESEGNESIVSVSGEIDAYTAPQLKEALMPLADYEKPQITVNLKDVTYMDSTGLGVFVGLYKAVSKQGGNLKLIRLSERLVRLFTITGLNDIITISSDSEGGLQ